MGTSMFVYSFLRAMRILRSIYRGLGSRSVLPILASWFSLGSDSWLRWLVFKEDLGYDATSWTCESMHKKGKEGIMDVWKTMIENKIFSKIKV